MKRDAQSLSLARARGFSLLRRLSILGLALALMALAPAAGIARPGIGMIGSDEISPRSFHVGALEAMGKDLGSDCTVGPGVAHAADHGASATPFGHGNDHGRGVGACCGIACHIAEPVDSAVADVLIPPAIEAVRIIGLIPVVDAVRIERPPRALMLPFA